MGKDSSHKSPGQVEWGEKKIVKKQRQRKGVLGRSWTTRSLIYSSSPPKLRRSVHARGLGTGSISERILLPKDAKDPDRGRKDS